MRSTEHKLERRNGFLFLGNQLALDFVNTRPVQDGHRVELLPDFDALLRWFAAAELFNPHEIVALRQKWEGSERARRTTEALRQLREKLRGQVLAWEQGGSLQHSVLREINELMAAHTMRTRLEVKGKSASTELWFEAQEPEDLFAPLAHSAAALFATMERKRVRKCARCVLHFQDTSKKGTRRWCSMQLCGNRLKVAAYAARQRRRARPWKAI